MSLLGVWLAEIINDLVLPQPMHRQLGKDKLSVEGYQTREYEEAQRVCPEFGQKWNLVGKHVLDVGSGLGGKPAYYATLGATAVTAIDIRAESVQATHMLAQHRHLTQIQPLIADAAWMPFPTNSFDVIVSINVLEHVTDLRSILAECKRVLRPGGLMFFHFPPFYSPWGAHLEGWVNFPWPNVFFSDATLIEVARRVEARQRNNAHYIFSAQVAWDEMVRLPDLNRATVREVHQLLKDLEVNVIEAHLLPFGRHFLLGRKGSARLVLRVLKQLATWPILREVITTKMVFVLSKT